METAALTNLLTSADPDPVEVIYPDSTSPVLLLCEHAGRAIPATLNGLSISREVLDSHRGWDIGAETVARKLADRLGAPLILQRYSRLVIDCNRPPCGEGSMVEESDGAFIPGNSDVSTWEREARIDEIFSPFERAITEQFAQHLRRCAFSIHSFTPHFGGQSRPWHAGFLTRTHPDTAAQLMASIQTAAPQAKLALNEPYQIDDASDWFIPVHAEPRGIPHCLVEIRNDLIGTDDGAMRWAELLGTAITDVLESAP